MTENSNYNENRNESYTYHANESSSYCPPVDSANTVYVTPPPQYNADGSSTTPDYNNAAQPEQDVTGLAVGSIVCAFFSFCCCGVPAIVGLVLGIVALGKKHKDVMSIIGVVLNALALLTLVALCVLSFVSFLMTGFDSEMVEALEDYANYIAYVI